MDEIAQAPDDSARSAHRCAQRDVSDIVTAMQRNLGDAPAPSQPMIGGHSGDDLLRGEDLIGQFARRWNDDREVEGTLPQVVDEPGTDVDFGALTRALMTITCGQGLNEVRSAHKVTGLRSAGPSVGRMFRRGVDVGSALRDQREARLRRRRRVRSQAPAEEWDPRGQRLCRAAGGGTVLPQFDSGGGRPT